MVAIILGNGFEEMEAIVPCDMLRRAEIQTVLAGIGGTQITGSRGIRVTADCTVEELRAEDLDMIVLPGGLGGVSEILQCQTVLDLVKQMHLAGKYVAAICAAPTVLAKLGLTDGKRCTCYPGMEEQMGSAQMQEPGQTVVDGNLITATAAGTAYDFAMHLIAALKSTVAASSVAKAIVLASDDKGESYVGI